jgi:hypothetical protein
LIVRLLIDGPIVNDPLKAVPTFQLIDIGFRAKRLVATRLTYRMHLMMNAKFS